MDLQSTAELVIASTTQQSAGLNGNAAVGFCLGVVCRRHSRDVGESVERRIADTPVRILFLNETGKPDSSFQSPSATPKLIGSQAIRRSSASILLGGFAMIGAAR